MRQPRPWSHTFFDCDTPSQPFGTFAPLLARWQKRAGARLIPDWRDFDITEFAGWHDMMVLDAVTYDPIDALTLIWGSRLSQICGYQPRGTKLRDSAAIRGLIDEDYVFWERVCKTPCIGLAKGRLDWQGRDHVVIERLYLPCGPSDSTVEHVVSFCHVEIKRQ